MELSKHWSRTILLRLCQCELIVIFALKKRKRKKKDEEEEEHTDEICCWLKDKHHSPFKKIRLPHRNQ